MVLSAHTILPNWMSGCHHSAEKTDKRTSGSHAQDSANNAASLSASLPTDAGKLCKGQTEVSRLSLLFIPDIQKSKMWIKGPPKSVLLPILEETLTILPSAPKRVTSKCASVRRGPMTPRAHFFPVAKRSHKVVMYAPSIKSRNILS